MTVIQVVGRRVSERLVSIASVSAAELAEAERLAAVRELVRLSRGQS